VTTSDRFSDASSPVGVPFMAGFTILSWACIFPITRWCLEFLQPFELVTLRLLFTGIVMTAVLAYVRPRWPRRSEFVALAVCAFFGVSLYNLLLSWGLVTLSAGAASFLTNTIPIFTALISVVVNRERLSRWSIIGMALAFAGVLILASGQPGGFRFGSGASMVLAASICSAAYIVLQRRLVVTLSPLETAAWLMILGAVFMLPFAPRALSSLTLAPTAVVIAVVLLAAVPGALGQISWLYVLKAAPAGRASSLLFLIPPLATLIGVVFLDEAISAALIGGGVLALIGVALVNGVRPRRAGLTL
jgi:drug/metabolite transporter (DMT)-like permease